MAGVSIWLIGLLYILSALQDGRTALFWATLADHPDVVKALLAFGANTEVKDTVGGEEEGPVKLIALVSYRGSTCGNEMHACGWGAGACCANPNHFISYW